MSKRLKKIHPHKSKIQVQLYRFFRHINIQTDGQTYTQADSRKDKRAGWQVNKDRQADTDRRAGRQVVRKTDGQTQRDVQADT